MHNGYVFAEGLSYTLDGTSYEASTMDQIGILCSAPKRLLLLLTCSGVWGPVAECAA